jgi:cyclopropane fatty-acyl-phospholipid synthase-like methyltransferase
VTYVFRLAVLVLFLSCATRPTEPPAYEHRFEHAEDWTRRFNDPARDAWQQPEKVVAAAGIEPGMTIADVGAGTGYFEPYLSRAAGPNGKVLALDVEPDMVRYLGERAAREGLRNVEAREVDRADPGLAAGSVDRILVADTWHHISNRSAYAARLRAALRLGGRVIILDFRHEAPRGPPPEYRIAPEEVVRELERAGLDAGVVDLGLVDQYIVVGRLSP